MVAYYKKTLAGIKKKKSRGPFWRKSCLDYNLKDVSDVYHAEGTGKGLKVCNMAFKELKTGQ